MTKDIALKIANEIADQFTNGFFNDRIAEIIHKGIEKDKQEPVGWLYDLAKYDTPVQITYNNFTETEEFGTGVYDAAFNIRPVYAKYKEQPNEYLIHKYTMLLEELIANEGEELKYLKAFDFETYSRLKKEFG